LRAGWRFGLEPDLKEQRSHSNLIAMGELHFAAEQQAPIYQGSFRDAFIAQKNATSLGHDGTMLPLHALACRPQVTARIATYQEFAHRDGNPPPLMHPAQNNQVDCHGCPSPAQARAD
jgi:hypothetical protein